MTIIVGERKTWQINMTKLILANQNNSYKFTMTPCITLLLGSLFRSPVYLTRQYKVRMLHVCPLDLVYKHIEIMTNEQLIKIKLFIPQCMYACA